MTDIAVLDPATTQEVLAGNRYGKTTQMLAQIAAALSGVVDTEGSVWATGLTEGTINSLRTRMYRHDMVISVRKATRDGAKGHVITARTIRPEEQG
jgi:hypothetical protein